MDFHNLIPKINVPVLILQGTGDTILSPQGAKRLYNELRVTKKKLIYYLKANHSQFMDVNSQNMYKDIKAWVKQF